LGECVAAQDGYDAKLRELVVRAELLVISVAIGIVQRDVVTPTGGGFPCGGEDIVVLPEVVGGLVPVVSVVELVAAGGIVAVGILDKRPVVLIKDERFVK